MHPMTIASDAFISVSVRQLNLYTINGGYVGARDKKNQLLAFERINDHGLIGYLRRSFLLKVKALRFIDL